MTPETGKQRVTVVSACMNAAGMADFAISQVDVTAEEIVEGIHLYLAAADLLEGGYEEPFVHFPESEAPGFLLPAVRQYLGMPPWIVRRNPSVNQENSDGSDHRGDRFAAG